MEVTDLPEPDSPTTPTISRGATFRLTPLRALTADPFTDDERTLLEVFCSKIAIGFDNVCLYEDLTALNSTLEQQVAVRTREVQDKSRLLEITLGSMSDGLAAFDEKGGLLVYNHQSLELLNLITETEDKPLHFSEIEARLAKIHQRHSLLGQDTTSEEIEFADGRIVQLRWTKMPGGGQVFVCQDITGERRHQRELISARAQAEAANRAKSQFLAAMSHEIRTPMTGVQGMLDLLQHTPLNQEQHELTTVIRESAYSLVGIINDILDFSKIEASKMQIEHVPLSLTRIVENIGEVLSLTAFQKGLFFVQVIDRSGCCAVKQGIR